MPRMWFSCYDREEEMKWLGRLFGRREQLPMLTLGALADPVDIRDYKYIDASPRARLPAGVELPNWGGIDLQNLPPIRNQQGLGSCVGMAATHVRETILRRMCPDTQVQLSPMALYFMCRELMGTIGEDSGAYLRNAFKLLAQVGVPLERDWPYIIDQQELWKQKPGNVAMSSAGRYKIYSYRRLEDIGQMRECLAAGFPFAVHIRMYPSQLQLKYSSGYPGDILPAPEAGEMPAGGHAIMVFAYFYNWFFARNSWGPKWCGDSNFWIGDRLMEQSWVDCWMAEG
mgnify:FL=1